MKDTKTQKNNFILLKKRVEPYLYILPSIMFFTLFSFYPFIKTVITSFFIVNAKGDFKGFAGFSNYINVLTDEAFLKSIWNTTIYVILASPVAIIIALVLALLANKKTRTSSIYSTMFALTMAMSLAVSAMIFKIMYSPSIGIINKIFQLEVNWLNDPKIAMVSLSFITVWINIGFNFLFLLAAIRGVPESLLENAELEGCNALQKARHVVVPLISPIVFFLICNSLARNIIHAGLPIILTDGGPRGSTSTMIFYMFQQAFASGNYNNAYASAVITFIFSLAAILISFSFEKKGVHYQ